MPRSQPTEAQRHWAAGHHPNSLMGRACRAEQKRLKELIKRDHQDGKAFERTARMAGWSV